MSTGITAVNEKCIDYCEIKLVLEYANWTDSRLHLVTKDKAIPSLKRSRVRFNRLILYNELALLSLAE